MRKLECRKLEIELRNWKFKELFRDDVSQILHPSLTVMPIVHTTSYKGMESNGGVPFGNKAKGKQAMLESITEAWKKVKYDTRMFKIMEQGKRYIVFLTHWTVFPSRKINFFELKYFGFERLFGAMGWLPLVYMNKGFSIHD